MNLPIPKHKSQINHDIEISIIQTDIRIWALGFICLLNIIIWNSSYASSLP